MAYNAITARQIPKGSPLHLNPNQLVRFCDLRGIDLTGDLSGVELFGCRLDGSRFLPARLSRMRLVCCFASKDDPTILSEELVQTQVSVIDSHLQLQGRSTTLSSEWPKNVAGHASRLFDSNTLIVNEAFSALQAIDNSVVAPLAACLLAHPEWDMRSVALRTIAGLRHQSFPHRDSDMLEWMFCCLGDAHSVVANAAAELLLNLRPNPEVLAYTLSRMWSDSPEEQAAGLRAAASIAEAEEIRRSTTNYRALADRGRVRELLAGEHAGIKMECLRAIAALDDSSALPAVVQALADPDGQVRRAAVETLKLLSVPPDLGRLLVLLTDPDEAVRVEVVHALGRFPGLSAEQIAPALEDPSPEVRQLARTLIEE